MPPWRRITFATLLKSYAGEQPRGSVRAAQTTVTRKEGGAISINCLLAEQRGRFRIVEIELDDQSLAHNVESQVQAVLKQGTYHSLVAQMEAHLKQPSS